MKTKLIILIAIVLVAIISVQYDNYVVQDNITSTNKTVSNSVQLPLPDISVQTIDGKSINLRNLNAEIILLNFWASWCAPCIKEFPDMIELVEKSNSRIALVAISIDNNVNDIHQFLQKIDINIEKQQDTYWVWDKDRDISLKKFNIMNVPETIIINKDRYMQDKIVGITDWKNFKFEPAKSTRKF